jgi:BON domain
MEVTVNIRFGQTVPKLRVPIQGRITRFRHQDGLAESLRDASTWLWRMANSIDAYHGKPVSPRPARHAAPTRVTLCGGMLAGMGMMYLMDRDTGRRHRALVRDQMTHYRRIAERLFERKGRKLTHRVRGIVLERTKHAHDGVVDDAVLVERIRSHMGHLLSHAETRWIEVAVQDGQVALSGHVVASHVNRVLGHVATVPGVHGLVTKLTVHPSVEDILGDQPGIHRPQQGGAGGRHLQAMGESPRPSAKA